MAEYKPVYLIFKNKSGGLEKLILIASLQFYKKNYILNLFACKAATQTHKRKS